MPKKTERGNPLGRFNIHSVTKHQKIEGAPLGKKFSKKRRAVPKKTGRGAFWSRPVLYVTLKHGTTLLVKFFDQMVQFDTLKYRRTFKNYFAQFVWIEKSH